MDFRQEIVRRHIAIGVAVFVGCLISVAAFRFVNDDIVSRAKADFERTATDRIFSVQRTIAAELEIPHSIAAFFNSAPSVGRDEFRSFVASALTRYQSVQALEWIPRVRASERSAYEQRARDSGIADFQITERKMLGSMMRAGQRDEYFPVYYVEPFERNERALGFDLASNATRLKALELSRDSGAMLATGRITLVQETGKQSGFLVFVPVYGRGLPDHTLEQRRRNLIGFGLAVFRIGDMITRAFSEHGFGNAATSTDIELHVFDESAKAENRQLHAYSSRVKSGLAPTLSESEARSGLHLARTFDVAGRKWTIVVRPTNPESGVELAWVPWVVLAAGMAFTGMLAAFLVSSLNRTRLVEGLVEERTAELAVANDDLARSNEELERFASVASHDLQEPLRMVSSYTQLLAKRYKGRLDDDADEFIAFAVDGASRMQRLIADLLAYSRVGSRNEAFARTDCAVAFETACANLTASIEESGATVTRDALPTLHADPAQLVQLLQNLIGNAVKYRADEPPEVHVSCERKSGDYFFGVKDNGIGIDPKYADQVFVIFQRLHTREEYTGTGVGLAVCKKIIERHGGSIWIESQPGEGATVRFSIPTKGDDSHASD